MSEATSRPGILSRLGSRLAGVVLVVAIASGIVLLPRVRTAWRVRAVLHDRSAAELTDPELAENAAVLVPELLAHLDERAARTLVARVWRLGGLDEAQRRAFLVSLVRVFFYESGGRRRWPESVAVSLTAGYGVDHDFQELGQVLEASLELELRVKDEVVGRGELQICPGTTMPKEVVLERRLDPGKHVVTAHVRARVVTPDLLATTATVEAPQPFELEVARGDERGIVGAVTGAGLRDGVELSFLRKRESFADARARVGARHVTFLVAAPRGLPCWIGHTVVAEVGGTRLAPELLVRLQPGARYGVTVTIGPLPPLAPGKYPLKITLRPDPVRLLNAVPDDHLDLLGEELVFERALVMEGP